MKSKGNYKIRAIAHSHQTKINGRTEVKDTNIAKPNLKKWIAVFFFLALIFGINNEVLAALNLEVPLEMVDFGLNSASGSGTTQYNRSGMNLTGDDYDNATYYFEIVAKNTYGSDRDVILRDYTGGTNAATITVPYNTTNFTRYRVSWTPAYNTKRSYVIRIQDTASAGQVVVQTARIIVQQTNATKTRIQIPLVQKEYNLSVGTAGNVATTTSTTYVQDSPFKYSLWKKDVSKYTDLAATNPWTLEGILDSTGDTGYAYAALFNATDNTQVTGAEINVYGTTWAIREADFADNATNFHNLDNFEVRIRSSSASYTAELRTAVRLYVRLTNLTNAEVLYRVARSRSAAKTAENTPEQRVLLDTSLFSDPLISFEASGYCADNNQSVFLRDHSTNDSGTDGSDVTGSGINFNSASKTIVRAVDISPTSGDRFYGRIAASTNNLELNHAWIVVQAGEVVVVGNGTDPENPPAPLAPGAGATMLDAFTLRTSGGSDTVTGVTVALSSGSSGGLSKVEITSDDGSTSYGYVDNPASDTVPISVSGMPTVITTPTQYKVRITPKSHANMPVPPPPGILYTVTGTVSGITCTYPKVYNDSGSATVKIDNDEPGVPTGFNATPGDTQVILNWTNPGDADFSEVVILRNTSDITEKPDEGTQYYQNDPIGTNGTIVRYVGSLQTFTDTGLSNEVNYYYKIFARDSNFNYSTPGTAANPYPCIPLPTVTANYSGTQIGTIDNDTNDKYIGAAFTFQQSSGTAGNITALTISETGDADADFVLSDVKVYYESGVSGSCVYDGGETLITTTSFNTSDKIVLSSISIPVSLSTNFTCVYVVFDVGSSVDRNNPYVELEITSSNDFTVSGGLIKAGTYPVALGTTTLNDTHPPGDVTGQTATVGNTQITLNWTNPSGGQYDDDYAGVRIRRTNGATPPANCSSGTQVVDVAAPETSYTNTGLTNGQMYSYRLCSYDENPGRLYATGVTITGVTPSNEPTLTYPASPYNDGKNPDTGDTTVNYTFKVIYTDVENDAPAAGYPKIYIGDNDGYTSYTMSVDSTAAYSLRDGTYSNSEQYVYGPIGLGAAQDLRFYFEAQAVAGNLTIVKLPSTGDSTGPSVYLMNAANMIGVPKELGSGLPYGSVLGDDSGVGYCVFWDSPGLDTGGGFSDEDWSYCNFGIQKGRGYYIFAASADTYRLDEPDGVENVTDTSVDIDLDPDGGWNMISNPYNVNIELQNVKVVRDGTENTFSYAVTNNWIGNSIYEWEGYLTGYTFKAYNGSPPAKLEPWVGYFIYQKDTTATTLRVFKP